MTTKFIVIIGLPGSGKTTLAKSLLKIEKGALFIDDFSLHTEEAKSFNVCKHDTVIITDPYLCNVTNECFLNTIMRYFIGLEDVLIQKIYFENDPDTCIKNALRDPKDGGTLAFIRNMTKEYVIPDGADVRKVYKNNE